jgi:molybdopterin/thiamine biosynthesis adenylyltransferase
MDRFERARAVLDVDVLAGKSVLVAGLGSGGATVALELAKAGVGALTLIDPDTIEETNLIRHECDDRYLGWNKAEAAADLIAHRNPAAEVQPLAADLFELRGRLERAVAGASIVAVCTDGEPPKHLLNRLCLTARVPAVYAGVYERGVGGELIRCPGGHAHACYACATSTLKESAPLPKPGDELDYGAIGADGTLQGVPGLGLDVRFIALLHAKLCLLELLGEPLGANVVLFGNAAVPGLFPRPFASALLTLAPQDACLVCGQLRSVAGHSLDHQAGHAVDAGHLEHTQDMAVGVPEDE